MTTFGSWLSEQRSRPDDVGKLALRLAGLQSPPRAWTPTGVERFIRGSAEIEPGEQDELQRQLAVAVADYRRNRGAEQEVPQVGEKLPAPLPPIAPPEPDESLHELVRAMGETLLGVSAMLALICTRLGISAEQVTEAIEYARYGDEPPLDDSELEVVAGDTTGLVPLDFGKLWLAALAEPEVAG